MTDSSSYYNSASAIIVDGNDVYIAGQSTEGNKIYISYWKNGVKTNVAEGHLIANANSLAVYAGAVYVAGITTQNDQTLPVYWKNAQPVYLAGRAGPYSIANSIVVNQTGVYVTGTVTSLTGKSEATYWKDNVPTTLAGDARSSSAINILVQGNDIYIPGAIQTADGISFGYWKNGTMNKLTSSFNGIVAGISDITVSGNDIYVGGLDNINGAKHVAYWKNSVEIFKSTYSSQTTQSNMAVDGSNVYLTETSTGATYWENGIEKKLQGPPDAFVSSIFIAHHN